MSAFSTAMPLEVFPARLETAACAAELIRATEDVLSQGLTLLFRLGDTTYSKTAAAPFQASIGGHYRHVLEHFESLIKGLRTGEINYDARERNLRLQSEVTYAAIVTCDAMRALKRHSVETLSRNCLVINSVGYVTSQPVSMDSNIGRELAYCIGQAIHHYAIIRLICHELAVVVPEEFGMAPSTLKHRAAVAS